MKVKILRATVASGFPCEPGKVVDISDRDARILIRMGKAVEEQPKPQKPVKASTRTTKTVED